jgi:aminoglycoside phosphotransferase
MAGEARTMDYLRSHGYPVPAVEEISDDGTDLVMERIDGRSMVEDMGHRPWTIRRQGAVLADLHRRLHAIPPLPRASFRPLRSVRSRAAADCCISTCIRSTS